MADISFDGQAFTVGDRRVFLVSGAIHYARVPRGLWRDRIRAAKQAGLNCIETYVFWNAHEREPGVFDFTGDLDLRRFIEIIGQEGMYCWLRPGPYVCAEWDGGGLPAWLETVKTTRKTGPMKLREASEPFMAACARYLTAVMQQAKGLQVTDPVKADSVKPVTPAGRSAVPVPGGFQGEGGGPILMVQAENEWFSFNPQQHDEYHRQLVRYLREQGCKVPITVCNQLWQPVDGTIHTWNASADLPASLRQLGTIQPDAPKIVSEYWTGWFDYWGGSHADTVDPQTHFYRLAGILAAGAMPNLYMFHGGTNFGFSGGRTINGNAAFMTTSYDYDAPLREGGGRGGRGSKYALTKRIAMFASQFNTVLANLDPGFAPVMVQPGEGGSGPAVAHLRGSGGDVVFVLREAKDKREAVPLLLGEGQTMTVPMGKDRAAWVLLNVRLGGGGATLDVTNLRPWAFVGDTLLVLYGPAGTEGVVSIDGAEVAINVPTGKTPAVRRVGSIHVAVLNEEQIDAAYLAEDGVVIGADGLNRDDSPRPLAGWATRVTIHADGTLEKHRAAAPRKPAPPKLDGWDTANINDILDGSAEGFREIAGPASLGALGVDRGYGWYRLETGSTTVVKKTVKTLVPHSGDRLHVYHAGRLTALLGEGPGATHEPVSLRLDGTVTVLADALGRFNFGQRVAEPVGLRSHFYAVKTVRLPKPEVTTGECPDPFALGGIIYHARLGERRVGSRLTWTIKPAGRKPLLLVARGVGSDATVTVNGTPVARVGHHTAGQLQLTLTPPGSPGTPGRATRGSSAAGSATASGTFVAPADGNPFTGGKNEVAVCFDREVPDAGKLAANFTLYQLDESRTTKAQWSFCPWQPPTDNAFAAMQKPAPGRPAWYRTTFTTKPTDVPLFLQPDGLTKGQLYLNGHNVGRYFVQTPTRKAVPPQSLYYLPEPWLNTDAPNELLIFDEHGFDPRKTRLTYRPQGPHH